MLIFKTSTLKQPRWMSQVNTIKEVTYIELSMLEEHQQPSMTYFLPTSSTNFPPAYECTRGIF